ncbi:Glucose/arabinose dehydrogenase, beta-propeller fold [Rubritalea squalenifaciens DSM 18772]|uniref:Glucose/arabinose dehydrogenase, beta-propeller fold n=1 Tax=Rubritalea squalenifaciens DSM 18772 TaxID=1123071 RepID=A0A1M6IAK1_9BACT|nr:PQQ-dependent sugar dehydrogenase [Rubritalea squalenifaciens]SHJ31501.1 Glucose/arabinose dehydrogenase, beta-propeller fold [Rubritalea squalenifaciens DSM 18772]
MSPSIKHLIVASLVGGTPVFAAPSLDLFVDDLKRPTYMTAPSGSSDYLYILEKEGYIRVFDRKSGKLLDTPLLDIKDRVRSKSNEQGLLGMAFSPTFSKDRRFYLYYTDSKGHTQVSRFSYPDNGKLEVDPASEEKLVHAEQPYGNHNGGWIDFGPDGMLYIGTGDGGAANDPKNNSQDLSNLLGKMLRIDVSTDKAYQVPSDNPFVNQKDAAPEIFAYGLRNPWRCSWSGDLMFIGDVGQNKWEEINVTSLNQLKGANFGWRLREGYHETPKKGVGGDKPENNVEPVHEYVHGGGPDEGLSVTGGYVYRGSISELKGLYFFADYTIGNVWTFEYKEGKAQNLKSWTKDFEVDGKKITQISSFAEDPQGELYIISDKGSIYQIVDK